MEFLRDTQIDFMKYRKFFIAVSTVLVVVGALAVFVHGKLNMGIDFVGGTQLTLRFQQPPQVDEIRNMLAGAGLDDVQIQRFGEKDANEVIVKTPVAKEGEEGRQQQVMSALGKRLNPSLTQMDLNRVGSAALAEVLLKDDPAGVVSQGEAGAKTYYEGVAEKILDQRQDVGIFSSWDQVSKSEGATPAIVDVLKKYTALGKYSLVGAENVGPQIGSELRKKGILAVVLSLFGMLLYIWFRFELRFGMGALIAVFHDVMVVLGLYAIFNFEFNLTTVAAFLTLVGYSVNDTVVIFDRVRENMRKSRRQPLIEILNDSINQTLTRTILTSGTTLVAVGAILFLGGDVLRGFAFVLTIGIVVGTYSSVYVASPFALLWEELFGGEAKSRRERKTKAA